MRELSAGHSLTNAFGIARRSTYNSVAQMPNLGIPIESVAVTPAPPVLLNADWHDLLWAAVTVGRPNQYYVFKHGASSIYEAIFRASLVRMAVEESLGGSRYLRTPACKSLDPSEKGAINYFLGLTLCKVFAEQVLNVPWMLHLDVFRNALNPALLRNERSRPDLVGRRADGTWIAFESKGRVSEPDSKTKDKAKDQARRLVSVLGNSVGGHYAGISFFTNDTLRFFVQDPERLSADDPRSIVINGEAPAFYRSYYQPFVSAFFSTRDSGQSAGEVTWSYIAEIDAKVGMHAKLLDLALREAWRDVGDLCRMGGNIWSDTQLRADGLAVVAGESWWRPRGRRGEHTINDE